jgi:hypothetical protein
MLAAEVAMSESIMTEFLEEERLEQLIYLMEAKPFTVKLMANDVLTRLLQGTAPLLHFQIAECGFPFLLFEMMEAADEQKDGRRILCSIYLLMRAAVWNGFKGEWVKESGSVQAIRQIAVDGDPVAREMAAEILAWSKEVDVDQENGDASFEYDDSEED